MRIAVYPGSFDPVRFGHIDIIRRSAAITDELIVGVLQNKAKTPLFSVEERVKMLGEVTKEIKNVKIVPFEGLLIDFAKEMEAKVIVRGLRAVTDFEYELQMAQTNHKLNSEIETLFMTTSLDYSYLSSSVVREIAAFDGDISQFVPEQVMEQVTKKIKEKKIQEKRSV